MCSYLYEVFRIFPVLLLKYVNLPGKNQTFIFYAAVPIWYIINISTLLKVSRHITRIIKQNIFQTNTISIK